MHEEKVSKQVQEGLIERARQMRKEPTNAEAKLVEKEFGGCSAFAKGDCDGHNPAKDFNLCYLHHIGRRYWELMGKHGFLDGPLAKDSVCIMASYYQFF